MLKDTCAPVTGASPRGGRPPLDPPSDDPSVQTDATHRFKNDQAAQAELASASTHKLRYVSAADFDAVFYPGGRGPLWDLAEDAQSIALTETTLAAGTPVAAGRGQFHCRRRSVVLAKMGRWLAFRNFVEHTSDAPIGTVFVDY